MDSFDKHTRKVLTESGQVPEGFGWEDMEAGINEKISEKKRDRKYPVWFWLLLLTFLGLAALSIGFKGVGTPNGESESQNNVNVTYTDLQQVSKEEKIQFLDESPSNDTPKNTNIQTIESTNDKILKTNSKSDDKSFKRISFNEDLVNENPQVNDRINSSNSSLEPKVDGDDSQFARKSTGGKLDSKSSNYGEQTNKPLNLFEKQESRIANRFTKIASAGFLLPISSKVNSPTLASLELNSQVTSNKGLSQLSKIYLLGNINGGLWRWNQAGNSVDYSIEDYEKTLETYGASMKVGYKFKRVFVETGLAVQLQSSYFEHVFDQKHTTSADSTPIYNALTMETRYETGGTKTVTERVRIGHYNQYGQVDVPLLVGIQIPVKRWGIYAKTGVQVSVLSWEKGRSISEVGELDELVSSTEFRVNRGFTYMAEGGMSYELNSKWSIQSGISYAQSITSWMVSERNVQRPSRLNLQIGLLMNLR